MCDVDDEAVVAAVDAPSIYDIPKVLHGEGWTPTSCAASGCRSATSTGPSGASCCAACTSPAHEVTVGLVGKYIDLPDAYLSVTEALRAGGFANDCRVQLRWVASDDCETPDGAARPSAGVDAVCVPGGFGVRGIEGKVGALRWARESGTPDARAVPGPAVHGDRGRAPPGRAARGQLRWSSTRTPRTRSWRRWPTSSTSSAGERDMGGTMRLGLYPAELLEGSIVARGLRRDRRRRAAPSPLRGEQRLPRAAGRGRAGVLRDLSRTVGSSSSSSCPRDVHPYYVGTQAHPEFRSRPTRGASAVRRPDRAPPWTGRRSGPDADDVAPVRR